MTAFEEIRDSIRAAFITRYDPETISEIESIICVTLGKYDITEKETTVVLYDGNDNQIMQKFFLSKAIQGLSRNSIKAYGSVLSLFFSAVGKHVTDITTDDIRLYLAKKKIEKASDCYLAFVYRTLSTFYGWCAVEDIVAKNPVLRVEKIKIHKKVEDALSEESMEALRYAAKTKREKALIEFLYSTGCRISEACALNISDVDFDNLEIKVMGKGQKERTVYLSQRARFALRDYLDSRCDNSPALFGYDLEPLIGGLKRHQLEQIGVDGRLQPDEARSIVKSIGKRAGLKVHPHLLRKTVATQALKRGMPIDQVKVMLGHESIATTQIYAQTDKSQVKQAHERFV